MADETESVSMLDVLEDDAALEEEANAVLGGSDDKNCTYLEGYVDRQALYSCRTCKMTDDDEMAGVCLACSLHCHDGHDLVELYTKRNFRCDCGNGKFADLKCVLCREKDHSNATNAYNHNFVGRYCNCNGLYPDPDDEVEDDMVQCVICEDWFHSRHLGTLSPDDFQEMTCAACMERLTFLSYYATGDGVPKTSNDSVDIIATNDASSTTIDCTLNMLQSNANKHNVGNSVKAATQFWKDNWRHKLCRCQCCQDLYATLSVTYLMNENDTVTAYEKKGHSKNAEKMTVYDSALQALDGMERTQKVEVLHEFNTMKEELNDYLKQFAKDGRVVRKEDIDEFFLKLKSRKRPRLEMPQHCR